jgi:DNA-binding response OmpR family regulator
MLRHLDDQSGYDLLLVEDDVRVSRALALALSDAGDKVRVAGSASEARVQLSQGEPDVILLDLGLPDGDGLDLCAELRSRSDVPIVIVTARGDSSEVVAGLEAGADDYVKKPVTGTELSARVRALLRRTERTDESLPLLVGDLEVDTRHGSVRRDGADVPLTRTERRLLRELALRSGDVVTREELLQRVWGYEYFGDTRLLDVHIRRLRTKLEVDPSAPRLVVTVRGLGYRLER